MKTSYNWLQNYFEEKLPEPEKVSEGIIFHSFEVEEIDKIGDDTVFDVKILPDRAHDCLSHWGIAKEISAIFDLKISAQNGFMRQIQEKVLPLESPRQDPEDNLQTSLKIEVEDQKCLRYMGRIVRNVKVGPSPIWLKESLKAIGQRPINNLVDAANFIMYDLGQPIHCFDLDKLESPKIIVRNGKVGEKLTTLDKKEINLDDSILVIADEKDPLAIAGIKGGMKAEVDLNTKNIVIEVANFNATTTRKTAKKINILTDAVKRYENEISPELCEKVMQAMTDLICSVAGGEVEKVVDIYPKKAEQKKVSVSTGYINKLLGSNFSKEEIENVWRRLNFEYKEKNDEFEITVPFLRVDIKGAHDLTEEVGRILGYEKIKPEIPKIDFVPKANEIFTKISSARQELLSDGYSEVMTYAFRDKGEVEVLASASDKKFLRINLADGLKESLKLNQLNALFLEMPQIKIFEIGTVFLKNKEEMHVAYNEKKEIKEMTLEKFYENVVAEPDAFVQVLGSPGPHPRPDHSQKHTGSAFKMWSLFPFISRDVAVWVPEGESSEKLKKILAENGTELLIKEPYLFDSFTKDGKTSYGFRLIFQAYDRTLTDEEINEIMTKISHKISENSSWQIR